MKKTFYMYGPKPGEVALIEEGDEATEAVFVEKGWSRDKAKARVKGKKPTEPKAE